VRPNKGSSSRTVTGPGIVPQADTAGLGAGGWRTGWGSVLSEHDVEMLNEGPFISAPRLVTGPPPPIFRRLQGQPAPAGGSDISGTAVEICIWFSKNGRSWSLKKKSPHEQHSFRPPYANIPRMGFSGSGERGHRDRRITGLRRRNSLGGITFVQVAERFGGAR